MTDNWSEVIFSVCATWVITLFLVFLINWNNNSYRSYDVEEYFKAKYCYSETYTYNNMPRVVEYCDKRSLTELLGESK